jgi:hypothetical protein
VTGPRRRCVAAVHGGDRHRLAGRLCLGQLVLPDDRLEDRRAFGSRRPQRGGAARAAAYVATTLQVRPVALAPSPLPPADVTVTVNRPRPALRVRRLPRWAFGLTPNIISRTARVVRAMRLKVILDLNLATGTPQLARDFVREAEAVLPPGSILGFEIGNEPDLYNRAFWRRLALATEPFGGGCWRPTSGHRATSPTSINMPVPCRASHLTRRCSVRRSRTPGPGCRGCAPCSTVFTPGYGL